MSSTPLTPPVLTPMDDLPPQYVSILSPWNGQHFLNNQMLSDFTIKCLDQEFAAHRVILAMKSPVFLNFFRNNPNYTELQVTGVPPKSVQQLLAFLYTETVNLADDYDLIVGVLKLGHRFDIPYLVTLTIGRLEDLMEQKANFLAPDNLLAIHDMAAKYSLNKIGQLVFDFCVKHKHQIMESVFDGKQSLDVIHKTLQMVGCTQKELIGLLADPMVANIGLKTEDLAALINLEKCSANDLFSLAKLDIFDNTIVIEMIEKKYKTLKQSVDDMVATGQQIFNTSTLQH